MLRSILLIAIVSILTACNKKDVCILEGNFPGSDKGEVLMAPYQRVSSPKEYEKYSTKFNFEGERFSKQIDSSLVARIVTVTAGQKQYRFDFFIEPGNISLSLVDDKPIVKAGSLNEQYVTFKENLQLDKYFLLRYQTDLSSEDKLFVDQFESKLWSLVEKYPKSIPLAKICNDIYWGASLETLKKVLDAFSPEIHDSYYLVDFSDRYNKEMTTAIGQQVIGFELEDDKKQTRCLEEFKGKYILIDFWASWCGPCRKEIPNLKDVYKAFNSKGLEIICVSIDNSEAAWLKAVKEEDMPWAQVLDTKNISDKYNVTGVPHILLISPEGKILAKDMHGKGVWEELEKYGFKLEN